MVAKFLPGMTVEIIDKLCQLMGHDFSNFRVDEWATKIETGQDVVARFFSVGHDTNGYSLLHGYWSMDHCYPRFDFTPLFS